ncbi:MAG TPA: uracil-DNA glycosylase [Gallionellaceae bacterium]
MNREEAVLRELNLYPLWQRRGGAVAASASPQQAPAAEPPLAAQPVEMAAGMGAADPAAERKSVISQLPWPELKTMVRDCTACRLRAGCTQTVFGVGDEKADWLFIGEGPGADEDAKGEPFVGQAGKLLDNMLLAIKLKRGSNVYIANIVKCRPPNNRTPEADEIATCIPYLHRQIALIQPKIIVALGKTAATSLLGRDAALGSLRGTVHDFQGTPLIITYHPAYLLRTPADKAKAWEDLRLAVKTKG